MPVMDVLTLIERAGSVSALADRLDVHHSTVCGWKRDGVLPAKRIRQIHEKMHVPLADLLPMIGTAPRRAKPSAKAA